MATPDEVQVAYDIVIEDYGFIIEPRSYRISPAPMLPPRVVSAQETLQDVIGETRMAVWSDFRGGIDDRYTSKTNRYYRGEFLFPTKKNELRIGPMDTSAPNIGEASHPVKGAGGYVNINGNPLMLVNDLTPPASSAAAAYVNYYANDTTGWIRRGNLTKYYELWNGGKIVGNNLYLFTNSQFYYAALTASAPYDTALTANSGVYRFPTIYDDRLYLAGADNSMNPQHKLFSMYPGTTSVIEIATLGKPDEEIRSLAVMAGTMYIGKPDGMWAFRQNRAWKVTGIEPKPASRGRNDALSNDMEETVEHQGWLYYHNNSQQYRFNGSVIEPLYSQHLSAIGGFHSDGDLLYVRALSNSQHGIWASKEGGIHNLMYDTSPTYNIIPHGDKIHLPRVSKTNGQTLYKYIQFADRGKYLFNKYYTAGNLYLPWVDGGFPTWPKSYNDIQIKATFDTYNPSNLSAGGVIDIYYEPYENTQLLVKSIVTRAEQETSDRGIIQNLRVRNRASAKITMRASADEKLSPTINMVSMSYTPRPPMLNQHSMRIRCEDNQELYNGSIHTYDGAQLQSIIMNLASLDKVKVWGPMGGATSVYYGKAATYQGDYGTRLRKSGDGQTLDLADCDTGNLYIGSYFPFDLIYFDIDTSASTLTAQTVNQYIPDPSSWSLASAAQLGAAQSIEVLRDTTISGGKNMAQSGYLAIQPTPMWLPTYGPAATLLPLYWISLKVHTSVVLDSIRLGKWCQLKVEQATSSDLTEEQVPIIAIRATEV